MKKLIPILLLLAFACKKYETQTNAQTINAITLKVGDSWSYQVTNYPATQTDTAVFTIIAQTSDTAAHIAGSDTIFKTQTTINGIVVDSGTITQIGMWCSLCNYIPRRERHTNLRRQRPIRYLGTRLPHVIPYHLQILPPNRNCNRRRSNSKHRRPHLHQRLHPNPHPHHPRRPHNRYHPHRPHYRHH